MSATQAEEASATTGASRRLAALSDRIREGLARLGGRRDGQRRAPPREPAPFRTLRRRLIATNLVVAALVLAVLSVGLYAFQFHTVGMQVDQSLASEAQHELPKALEQPQSQGGDEHEAPYAPTSPNLFSVTMGPSGQVLQDDDQVGRLGLPDLASTRAVLAGRSPGDYTTVTRGAYQFRLYTVPLARDGHIVGAIQVGTSLGVYDAQLHGLLLVLLLLDGGVLALTGLTSVWLIGRSLVPANEAFARQRQFAAAASHELRTPLALIRSQAELIAEHEPAERQGQAATEEDRDREECTEVAADAREIVAETEYMTRLVSDLLLLARDEHDQRAMVSARVDLAALARDVTASLEPLARAKGLALTCVDGNARTSPAATAVLVPVMGDADRLRQLLLILLDNAIRYTPGGGEVRVTVRALRRAHLPTLGRGGMAELTVRDTGPGIAPEHLPHVFEPFYRATHGTQGRGGKEGGGAGLGLALASWIVEAHGGRVSVASEPGRGSVFTVLLPLAG